MSILDLFSGKRNSSRIKLVKADSGEWMVKKGHRTLYVGSKRKCELYLENTLMM
ncbi:MAG: hypothetical protein RLN88_08770 [Ekhidna sp.]|uniref:hypothetical protein n=1 Tax=Ekhidna sp. TaxID=2608089 RepID=UPI0032EF49B2